MVATGDATIRLSDGQRVTVDGAAGTVHAHLTAPGLKDRSPPLYPGVIAGKVAP